LRPIDLASLSPVGPAFGRIDHLGGQTLITAGAATDAFVPPDGGAAVDRLPGLRLPVPAGVWGVSARVTPDFAAAFDAGALMLRTSGTAWAKLAFERAPDGRSMAVSVVTRDVSDDANGPVLAGPALYLRACFTGTAHAFHVSTDGRQWDLVRFFALPAPVVAVDIVAQSPTGQGCRVQVDAASLLDRVPANLRDGS
jgi:regulation of enolase protein 1 (concanavalin A-like superfamily)